MNKKLLYIVLATLLVVSLIAACAPTVENNNTNEGEAEAEEVEANEAEAEEAENVEEADVEEAEEEMAEIPADSILTVAPASQTTTTFTKNFNPFTAQPLFPTVFGIYEPLMIGNIITGELTPWLATEFEWSEDLLALTFTIREGVEWSDGTPFTANDVAFTFNLLKGNTALQGRGQDALGDTGYVDTIEALDDFTVVFSFNRVYSPGFYDIIRQVIVPEHIWANVEDPVTEINEIPVGTGPFTEVANFQDQVYQIDRNPNYWQPGKPYFQGLRMPGFSGNDTSATMLVNGDVQWTGQFFPNVDEAVIAQNPEDLHCWWPTVTSDQIFMVNTEKAPFDDVVVRKAISMSFDREQLILVALQGKSTPADITGLSDGFSAWKVDDISSLGEDWTQYDPEAANAMLDAAGYEKDADGYRTTLDGAPLEMELIMVNGFSDWLAIAPLLKQYIEAIGFKVVINNYDVPIAFDKWMNGDFDISLYFGVSADLPYGVYRAFMSRETYAPIGEVVPLGGNLWRYVNEDADAALEKFATAGDYDTQLEAAHELQQLMADNAPVIPVWHAATFYCYSSANFTNWPDADNQYAYPMPIGGLTTDPGQLLVLTTIQPK